MNNDKQKNEQIVVGDLRPSLFRRLKSHGPKRLVFLSLLTLILVAGVGMAIGYSLLKDDTHDTPVAVVCDVDDEKGLASRAAFVLNKESGDELKNIVEEIQKKEGYTADPNCMYPVAKYYINVGDEKNAQQSIDQLKSAASQGKDKAPEYKYYSRSIEELETQQKKSNEINDKIQENTIFYD